MAVQHIVWLKFNDGVGAERIDEHLRALATLPEAIAEITGFSIGENFTDRARGYTHGLIVTLGSRDDLPRYIEHPRHQQVAGALRQDAELLVMDYES